MGIDVTGMQQISELKIGALLPVRLMSERLPNKAIMKVCGRPVLLHLLDRVCASSYLNQCDVVVCTTRDESDDKLIDLVHDYGCSTFRGKKDDIIDRLHEAAQEFEFDAMIQVDGDDPLSDTFYMDRTMEKLLSDASLDIVTCHDLPLGIGTKSFTKKAIDSVHDIYQTEKNDTGFIYYFTKTGMYKHAMVGPEKPGHILRQARLTLDYPQDFDALAAIFDALYTEGEIFGLDEIVGFLRENPEVMAINASLDDEYWARTKQKAQLAYRSPDGVVIKIPEDSI